MAELALQREHVLGVDTLSTMTTEPEERKPLVEEIRRVNGVYDSADPVLRFERDGVA